MKTKYNDIKLLIDKFFDGDTTLDEEQRLYDFFGNGQVPKELEEYRPMFVGFGAMLYKPEEHTSKTQKAILHPLRRKLIYALSGIAASIILFVGIMAAIDFHEDQVLARTYAGSYIIVNGERIDDLSRIKPDIEHALSNARHIESHVERHSTVKQAEQDVLDNIDDPLEKVRIEQLLNE